MLINMTKKNYFVDIFSFFTDFCAISSYLSFLNHSSFFSPLFNIHWQFGFYFLIM